MKINGTPDGGGKSAVIEGLTITSNGTYTAGAGVDGYSPVEVDVPAPEFVTETLSVSVNGTYTPSEGVDGYSQVNVNVPIPQFVTEPLNVSANGTYTPGQGIDGYSQVVVDVPTVGWDQKSLTEGNAAIINLDNSASFVASKAFQDNKTIQTVNLPYATSVGNSAFYSCTSLAQISLPVCSYICASVFYHCILLSQINLPMCSNIGYETFYNCSSLSIITIGYSGVCSLIGSAVFTNTQITSSTGSIYVPASLVDSYKSAKNWSYFSTQIFPIE